MVIEINGHAGGCKNGFHYVVLLFGSSEKFLKGAPLKRRTLAFLFSSSEGFWGQPWREEEKGEKPERALE